jgi:hypothetical protein
MTTGDLVEEFQAGLDADEASDPVLFRSDSTRYHDHPSRSPATAPAVLDSGVGLVSLIGLERELTSLLGAPVEVVPASGPKRGVRNAALTEAIPL